jgi:uncharacterized protein YlaN (UPF0358 family)
MYSQAEKIQECIKITKAIDELGIPKDCPGRQKMKDVFHEWIQNNIAFAGRIGFYEWNRYAEVLLPASRKPVFFVLRFSGKTT